MQKKGQALVEFIIILPIFLMLILASIDIGNIIYNKITLESKLSDIISLYEQGSSPTQINEKLKLEQDNLTFTITDNKTFNLSKEISIITPGLNIIFDKQYLITTKRSLN